MNDVPEDLKPIYRHLVWAMVDHSALEDPAIQVRYGLNPASADVTEMEHTEADRRQCSVEPLTTQIALMSQLAGIVAHIGIMNSPDSALAHEVDSSDLGTLFGIASFAVITNLIASGYLVPNFPEVHSHG